MLQYYTLRTYANSTSTLLCFHLDVRSWRCSNRGSRQAWQRSTSGSSRPSGWYKQSTDWCWPSCTGVFLACFGVVFPKFWLCKLTKGHELKRDSSYTCFQGSDKQVVGYAKLYGYIIDSFFSSHLFFPKDITTTFRIPFLNSKQFEKPPGVLGLKDCARCWSRPWNLSMRTAVLRDPFDVW